MLTIAPPEAAEARSNSTFEALMWSMARPGETRDMPVPGLAPVIEALIDRECVVYTDSDVLRQQIIETGAEIGSVTESDHLFLETMTQASDALAMIRCGSALYPDDGATLVVQVEQGGGERLRLSGPGIEGHREIKLALPAAFWRQRRDLCLYPEGFELILVDGHSLISIPRSTDVEVL
jgi:alpha-D-ribose 1-methylphosphonate 5-triphosphate synthase subunit PhnH